MSSWPVRIIHFGLGRFHRAHQAVYLQNLFEQTGEQWGIASFSMRSSEASDQMRAVNNLYPVIQFSKEHQKVQWVESISESCFAETDRKRLLELFASSQVSILSLTVTEKAYQTIHLVELVAKGLQSRFQNSRAPLTIISCDNLLSNGEVLKEKLISYVARLNDAEFYRWVEGNITFPNTMVDRIVPALTSERLEELQRLVGTENAELVATETFSQWVIEDKFAGPKPSLEKVGVQFVKDVRPYEEMKLRLLNASHSAIAYKGLLKGFTFVHQAIRDKEIMEFVQGLHKEVIPLLSLPLEFNLQSYCNSLLERFDNESLPHQLKQIAMDGSQKLKQRILPSLRAAEEKQLPSKHLREVLDAWTNYCYHNIPEDPLGKKIDQIKSSAPSFEQFRHQSLKLLEV